MTPKLTTVTHQWTLLLPTTPTPNPQGLLPTNLQQSCTIKGPPIPLPPTHRKYHPPTYNTCTLIKGPPPPTPNPQKVPPTNLQHSYTKGTPTPLPQPTGSTTHNLTTLNTLKGPPAPTPYHQPTGSTTHNLTTHIH